MSNASREQLDRLQAIMDRLKSNNEYFDTLEQVDMRNMLDTLMCIHQSLEILAEIVKPE